MAIVSVRTICRKLYSFLQAAGPAGRNLKLFALVVLAVIPAAAQQFTQVQGTVIDPHGLPYANGTITPTLVISGSPRWASTGLPYTPPNQPTGLSQQGHFIMNLADVNALIPAGGTWSFLTCSAAGTIPPSGGAGPVCFTITGIVVTGTVMDISAQLQAAALPLGPPVGGGTITGATPNGGLTVTGTTLGLIGNPLVSCSAGEFLSWQGTAWVCANVTGGGGGNVSTVGLTVGVIPQASGSTAISNSSPQLDLISNANALTFAGAGGFVLPNTGTAGSIQLGIGTTNPTIAANTAGWMGASGASMPSYLLQMPLVPPNGTNTFMSCQPPLQASPGPYTSACAWTTGGTSTGGVTGSGTAGHMTVWTGTSTIGDSIYGIANSSFQFGLQPIVNTGTGPTGIFSVQSSGPCPENNNQSGDNPPQVIPTCMGIEDLYSGLAGSNAAVAALFVSNQSTGTSYAREFGAFIRSDDAAGHTTNFNTGVYGEAIPGANTTDNKGIFAVAGSNMGANTLALNAALVAQTYANQSAMSASYGLHILSPFVIVPSNSPINQGGGILIEDQTINGNTIAGEAGPLVFTQPLALQTLGSAASVFGGPVGMNTLASLGYVPANGVAGFVGPPTSSTSYFLQLPAASPTSSTGELSCGAVTNHLSPCTWVANGGGAALPVAISALQSATAINTLSLANFPQYWQAAPASGQGALNLQESSPGISSTNQMLSVGTAAGSATVPVLLTNSLGTSQSSPALQINSTFNTTAVVPGAIAVNVTNTASANGSGFLSFTVSGTQNRFAVTLPGNVQAAGSFQSVTTAGFTDVCGGQCTAQTSTTLGNSMLQGSDNTGTGASTAAATGILRGGGLNSTGAVNAAAMEGLVQVLQPYKCGGTCTAGLVMCASTTTQLTAIPCPPFNPAGSTTVPPSILGISAGTTGLTVYVVVSGQAVVTLDAGGFLSGFICLSPANTGTAAASSNIPAYGGSQCGLYDGVGVLVATSGAVQSASGAGITNPTGGIALSATNALIQVILR
jgi:hypothetical protein